MTISLRNSHLSYRNPGFRVGLTLIEVLVALTMTLIVLGAMIAVFSTASKEMARKRALIEMHNQIRPCVELLRSDLGNVTVETRAWALESSPNGYFEAIEGPRNDLTDFSATGPLGTLLPTSEGIRGDFDDIISMTVRSDGKPFRGRWIDAAGNTQVIESNVAEIVWYTDFDDKEPVTVPPTPGAGLVGVEERVTVYRRVLLIRPDLLGSLNFMAGTPATPESFFLQNDVSASFVSGAPIPNSLEDLAKRQNRFGHNFATIPFIMDRDFLRNVELSEANLSAIATLSGDPRIRQVAGNDIVVRDVVAFDMKVWSPDTAVRQANPGSLAAANTLPDNILVQPGDPAYIALGPNYATHVYTVAAPTPIDTNAVGLGAFVDLGYMGTQNNGFQFSYSGTNMNVLNSPRFSTFPNPKSRLRYLFDPPGTAFEPPFPAPPALPVFDIVYDTFSNHFESNGVDDDGLAGIDQGTNGLDDDGVNGIDDVGEREVEPPYPFELNGVKVTIRLIHRESAQVHQSSVLQSFVRK